MGCILIVFGALQLNEVCSVLFTLSFRVNIICSFKFILTVGQWLKSVRINC